MVVVVKERGRRWGAVMVVVSSRIPIHHLKRKSTLFSMFKKAAPVLIDESKHRNK